jgi:hypothetical protein
MVANNAPRVRMGTSSGTMCTPGLIKRSRPKRMSPGSEIMRLLLRPGNYEFGRSRTLPIGLRARD